MALCTTAVPFATVARLVVLLLSLSLPALAATPTSAVPPSRSLTLHKAKDTGDAIFNPLRPPSHGRPSRQQGDHYAGSVWWADGGWLAYPFSSSMTLDKERALLPPLRRRQPIYCYFDAAATSAGPEQEAEKELLLTWRRAWWARGFRPVILTAADALRNPTYDTLQLDLVSPQVQHQLMSFLAWEMRSGGVLTDYTLLPIVSKDDSLLSFIGRGNFARLTKWSDLGDSLFVGPKHSIAHFLRYFSDPHHVKLLQVSMVDVPDALLRVDHGPASLASYTHATIASKYSKVSDAYKKGRAEGLISLNSLITAHLHNAWQTQFTDGIEVLKPHPQHMTAAISQGTRLAQKLASCPETPMPSSCPPNVAECTPCVARMPMRVSTPARYHNKSTIFSIGTVPHPWTLAMLNNMRESLNVSWIRRESPRDWWLTKVTQDFLGTGVSSSRRILSLKEAMVGHDAMSRSFWLVAEGKPPADLSWHFGFSIPQRGMDRGESQSPVPAHRLAQQGDVVADYYINGPLASDQDVAKERLVLDKATHAVFHIESEDGARLRTSFEAWSMGDSEAWKFVRALTARNMLELQAMYNSDSEKKESVAHI
ncbi:hypothetical protein CDD81_6118 [Ophiocordyceps australis]|uniref:Uncharacterized protein n=1 Tax=Ophiocordyceps australis TaxID=1399860 RepID=A0A2C5Y8Q2_9HYPO|nr:hypothetical protein CDD81_6118 [Ophiocordyceps australis]